MSVIVRPVRADDDVARFGPLHGADIETPRRRRSVVADDRGAVVGVATALWSRRHPDFVQTVGFVDPEYRRRGIGSLLLRSLEALVGAPLLVAVEAERDGEPAVRFLTDLGYHVLMESTTVRLSLDDALTTVLLEAQPPPDVHIQASGLTSAVEDLYEAIYAQGHRWAGRYVPTPGSPWIGMAGDVMVGTMFVAADATGLIAATALQTGPFATGADGFIAPTGVLHRRSSAEAVVILRALLARTLVAGRALGVARVNLEYDASYGTLATVARRLPAELVSLTSAWSSSDALP